MKLNDLLREKIGTNDLEVRSRVVNRLMRVGFTLDTEVTPVNEATINSLISVARLANVADQQQQKTASLGLSGAPRVMDATRCPVCKSPMGDAVLHEGSVTKYCVKCRVARRPGDTE